MAFLWSKKLINKFIEFFSSEEYPPDESITFMKYVLEKRGPANFVRYNYRAKGMEDIRNVFNVTKAQEDEMRAYFIPIFSKYIDDTDLTTYDSVALRVAQWVNTHTIYTIDKTKYNFWEYWNSPYEMFCEIRDTGKLRDDCDGYAVLIVYIWKLIGIPAYRRTLRAGMVNDRNGKPKEGHATALYLPYQTPTSFFPLEGSYYAKLTNGLYLDTPLNQNKLYGETWFRTNEVRSYRGDIQYG